MQYDDEILYFFCSIETIDIFDINNGFDCLLYHTYKIILLRKQENIWLHVLLFPKDFSA